ncbi:hypothetical protein DFJ74DRAFT_687932 [Hyaloraphidium curvatum]|nr:hypothetical protein DFJ74DRAFT_687932 [Hyaloraphidium curvatum]
MSRFVRQSKFRHVFGQQGKRPDQVYDNIKVSRSAWDTDLVKANVHFISVNLETGGGGAFAVIPLGLTGKLPDGYPVVNGHAAAVLDTDWHPYNDYIVASGSEDTKAMVWKIPEGGLTQLLDQPLLTLSGHGKKVGHVLFHPTAENVLATAAADQTVKLWDVTKGEEKGSFTGFGDNIQGICWNWDGSQMATVSKDKTIRVFDPRTGKATAEAPSHQGVKASRVVWLGDTTKVVTTGFSRSAGRQMFVWDTANLKEPLKQEDVDNSAGVLIPHYDPDTKVLFVAGKGDGNIRMYEWADDEGQLHFLTEFKTSDPLRGIGFLPKRGVKTNECEVDRAFKAHTNMVEPISFIVPRKADTFQADIFPDCIGDEAALTADEYFAGKNAPPKLISLAEGFKPQAPKEFVVAAAAAAEHAPPPAAGGRTMSEKEFQDGYYALLKENEQLKARIRDLETSNANLVEKSLSQMSLK